MRSLIALLSFLTLSAFAQDSGKYSIRVEPLYGIEHSYSRYPEPARATTKTLFGARVLAGITLLSFELEGTQSTSQRETQTQKAEETIQRLLVGLRSTIPTSKWVGVFFRAGARGTQEKATITELDDNTKTEKNPPINWAPYAGTGIQVAIGNNLAASFGATWAFRSGGPPDVQYSGGLTVKFGQIR